jgi:hypothetical protein
VIGTSNGNQVSEPFPVIVSPDNGYTNTFVIGDTGAASITITAPIDNLIEDPESVVCTVDTVDSVGNSTGSLVQAGVIEDRTTTTTTSTTTTTTSTTSTTTTEAPLQNYVFELCNNEAGAPLSVVVESSGFIEMYGIPTLGTTITLADHVSACYEYIGVVSNTHTHTGIDIVDVNGCLCGTTTTEAPEPCECLTVSVETEKLQTPEGDLYYIQNLCNGDAEPVLLRSLPGVEYGQYTYFGLCGGLTLSNMFAYGATGDPFPAVEGMSVSSNGVSCEVGDTCEPVIPSTTTTSTTSTTTTVDPYTYYVLEGCPGTEYEATNAVVRTLTPATNITGFQDGQGYSIFGSCWFISRTTDVQEWLVGAPEQPAGMEQYTITEPLEVSCTECMGITTTTTTVDPYTYYMLEGCPGSEYEATNAVVRTLTPATNVTGFQDGQGYSIFGSCWFIASESNFTQWNEGVAGQPVGMERYTITEALEDSCLSCQGPLTTTSTTTTTSDPYTYYIIEGCPGSEYEATQAAVRTLTPSTSEGQGYSIFGNCWFIKSETNVTTWQIGVPEQPAGLEQYTINEELLASCAECQGSGGGSDTTTTTTRRVGEPSTTSYKFNECTDPENSIYITKSEWDAQYGPVFAGTNIEYGISCYSYASTVTALATVSVSEINNNGCDCGNEFNSEI